MTYSPNPNFYDDQIDDVKKDLEKYRLASYSSSERAYIVDGKKFSQAKLDSEITKRQRAIAKLEGDKKKFGKFGPAFGPSAKNNAAGEQFLRLYKAAADIKVTDFDSSVANVEAWKKVTDFVANNPNIKVAVDREASLPRDGGGRTRGRIKVLVDPTQDPTFAGLLKNSPVAARESAVRFAEEGTVETRQVVRGDNPNTATTSTRRVVTNPTELNRRQGVLDRIGVTSRPVSTAETRQPVSTTAPATGAEPAATAQTPATATGRATTARRSPVSADAAERRAMGATPVVGGGGDLGGGGGTGGGGGLGGGGGTGGGGGIGGGGGTGAGGTDRTRRSKLPKNWEAKFREMFPEQSWLLDLDKTKYPQLNKLIQQGIINRSWETPESQARFNAELQNTDFYRELANTGKIRQIKSLVGDLGFDSVPFNKFLTTAMNFAWEGQTLKSEVYKEAFRKDDSGNYVNPTAIARARASSDWMTAQSFGRQFFNVVSDSTIEKRLTGVITDEDIQRQQRELAKTKYSHLANLFDQDLTLEDIAGSFRRQASQILERDVNDIDMGSADFETAFNFGEEGKKRMMSTGEWEIMLRSDAKYGWDKTENAKQEARGLAASIAQAFGKVI